MKKSKRVQKRKSIRERKEDRYSFSVALPTLEFLMTKSNCPPAEAVLQKLDPQSQRSNIED